jgi:2-hydroxy-6-oxonona-2,4-dienedioate hydrolase
VRVREPVGQLQSRYTRVGGLTLHARVSAEPVPPDTPPMVLVHGLVISSLYMVPTARRLAPFHPVYAPDLPGFGLSDKPREVLDIPGLADALLAWMDAEGVERPVLVGNSLGCQVIVDLAARHPECLCCAVLAGPTMDPHARNAPAQITRWLYDWTLERPSLALAHVRDYYQAGLRRALHTFRHALRDPVEEKLPRVQAPTLVVRGARDRIVPQYWAEEAARLLPRGRLVVIPGGPHVVNYTTPGRFVRVVRAFLEGG